MEKPENTAVYIGKLVLEDFKSFKGRNELDLMDESGHLYQWTVFLGNNNTGKTNLLKAIADLEAGLFTTTDEISDIDEADYVPLNMLRDHGSRRLKSFDHENSSTSITCGVFAYDVEDSSLSINTKNNIFVVNYSGVLDPEWGYKPSRFWRSSKDDLIKNLKIYGFGVSRKINKSGISNNIEYLNAASLFNNDYCLANIEDWLFQLDYASKNGQTLAGERLQLLKEIIKSEILPEIQDFRFTTSDDLKNYIEYQTKDGWFLFDELGYGYQTTISWIIDLCKKLFERYPKSSNPLKEPAVVLVDELDLHLHPKWQKTIIEYLSRTFTATQFIVTTHSPLILQTLEKVNLFALIKKEDYVQIQHIPYKTLQGWSVEEILAEIMEMEEGVFSDKHNQLYKEFDAALDEEDYERAKTAYDSLMEILNPRSAERKILKLQLSQIAKPYDKA